MKDWVPSLQSIEHVLSAAAACPRRAHNLPSWNKLGSPFKLGGSQSLTSHPVTRVNREWQNILLKVHRDNFRRLLRCDQTRLELRAWLVLNQPLGTGALKLDRWTDEQKTSELIQRLREQCQSLFG